MRFTIHAALSSYSADVHLSFVDLTSRGARCPWRKYTPVSRHNLLLCIISQQQAVNVFRELLFAHLLRRPCRMLQRNKHNAFARGQVTRTEYNLALLEALITFDPKALLAMIDTIKSIPP